MPKYQNTTKGVLDFVVGGTPSEPEFASFKAGETRGDVKLNLDHPAVAGALATGALVDLDAKPEDVKAAKRSAHKAENLPAS